MEVAATIALDMGIAPGDLVGGKYRVVRIIGHGGMGVVVEAVHEALGQRVAIKFLRPQAGSYDEAAARFLLEAKALARLMSVHLARVTDVSSLDEAAPFFVMEYLDGHDLGAALAAEGVLSVSTAVDYALQVCEALAEAFGAGIVHRDIKPSNIFLTKASDGSTRVKLLDFGISKHTQPGRPSLDASLHLTRTRTLMGSPRYMAPEQMRSMRRVDHRADIWSLGVVVHEALTGQPAFVGETLPEVCAAIAADDPVRVRQFRRDVPIELQEIIVRCLEKDPEQRYRDVGHLAKELEPFAPEESRGAARRIARILEGAPSSVPPGGNPAETFPSSAPPRSRPPRSGVSWSPAHAAAAPSPSDRPSSFEAPSPLRRNAAATEETQYEFPPASANLGPGVPPPEVEDTASRRQMQRWAIAVIAAVALPAILVGALLPSPSVERARAHDQATSSSSRASIPPNAPVPRSSAPARPVADAQP